jgi:hypothetical protein
VHRQLDPAQINEAKRTLEVIGRERDVALGKLKAFCGIVLTVRGVWIHEAVTPILGADTAAGRVLEHS